MKALTLKPQGALETRTCILQVLTQITAAPPELHWDPGLRQHLRATRLCLAHIQAPATPVSLFLIAHTV